LCVVGKVVSVAQAPQSVFQRRARQESGDPKVYRLELRLCRCFRSLYLLLRNLEKVAFKLVSDRQAWTGKATTVV
jgi:hypothetical protein